MGRFGHRSWRGAVAAALAAAAVLLPRETRAGDELAALAAREVAQPRAATIRPERRRSGGESLERSLLRRLDEEERIAREQAAEATDEALREVLDDLEVAPAGPFDLSLSPFDTPSTSFLIAVSPPRATLAPKERRGFDRLVARELARQWRNRYRADLAVRRAADLHPWNDVYDAEEQLVTRAVRADVEAGGSAPFPSYLEGHPANRDREPVVSGERIELARMGTLTVDNDLGVGWNLRAYLPPTEAAVRAARRHPAHARGPGDEPVRGNIYSTDWCRLEGRATAILAGDAFETGFVSRLETFVDWTFLASYDRRDLLSMRLDVDYQPDDAEIASALMVRVAGF